MKEEDITIDNLKIEDSHIFYGHVNVLFEPKEDITAYELAKILPYIHYNHSFTENEFESLDEGVKRHFRKT